MLVSCLDLGLSQSVTGAVIHGLHGLHRLHGLHGRGGVGGMARVLGSAIIALLVWGHREAVRRGSAVHGTGCVRSALVTGVSVGANGTKARGRIGLERRSAVSVLPLRILIVVGLSGLGERVVVRTRIGAIVLVLGLLLLRLVNRVGSVSVRSEARRRVGSVRGSLSLVKASSNLALRSLVICPARVRIGRHGSGGL